MCFREGERGKEKSEVVQNYEEKKQELEDQGGLRRQKRVREQTKEGKEGNEDEDRNLGGLRL